MFSGVTVGVGAASPFVVVQAEGFLPHLGGKVGLGPGLVPGAVAVAAGGVDLLAAPASATSLFPLVFLGLPPGPVVLVLGSEAVPVVTERADIYCHGHGLEGGRLVPQGGGCLLEGRGSVVHVLLKIFGHLGHGEVWCILDDSLSASCIPQS